MNQSDLPAVTKAIEIAESTLAQYRRRLDEIDLGHGPKPTPQSILTLRLKIFTLERTRNSLVRARKFLVLGIQDPRN